MAVFVAGCFSPTVSMDADSEGIASTSSGASSTSGPGPVSTTISVGSETGGGSVGGSGGTTAASSEDTSGNPTTATSDGECVGGGRCLSIPGGDWQGPALVLTEEGARCPAEFPETILSVFADLQAPAAECGCDCGTPQEATCAPYDLTYFDPSDTECDTPLGSFEVDTIPLFDCSEPFGIDTDQRWQLLGGEVVGTCEGTSSSEVEGATWGETALVCGGPLETCSGGACEPVLSEGQLCVWTDGETSCPVGTAYSDRRVFFSTLNDGRDCSDCSCSVDGKCGGEVFLNAQFGCSSSGGLDVFEMSVPGNGDDCSLLSNSTVNTARAQEITAAPSCVPSGGESIGSAEPASPFTFCCVDK